MCRAPLRSQILGGLSAFRGAGLARVAASLAYANIGEFVAFLLAVVAKHLDDLSKMAGVGGVHRGQSGKRAATGNKLEHSISASGHARVLHRIHAETMSQAIIAGRDTFNAGFLETLIFRRMHLLHLSAPHSLGEGL